MESENVFVYSWCEDKSETEVTALRVYGLNKKNHTVCLLVNDFTPYVYIELPTSIDWTASKAQMLAAKLDELSADKKPLKKTLVWKKRLYYASEEAGKLYPYLCCSFSSRGDIRALSYRMKKTISVPGIGYIKLKMHEDNANTVLQLTCARNIPTAGWVKIKGVRVLPDDMVTNSSVEYTVKWKDLSPYETNDVVNPLIMSYDIEVYSSDPSKMPTASKPKDVVFQISCVFARNGDKEEKYNKFLLTLGEPNPDIVGEDVSIYMYEKEFELLQGFTDIMQELQPNIICGYNIFTFDIPFMIDRAKLRNIMGDFDRQGFNKYGHAEEKTIEWSSSAYKNQKFQYLDAEGRIFVDILPLVRRDFKFDTYTLKNVSTYFLGETKDPLTPKDIFKYYEYGMKGGEKGAKALGLVGKYCVQDSALTLKLFEKLQTWFGLTEMAKICNVSIFTLYTQGQQIKVFSQIYKKCMSENVVVERDGYITKDTDHYQGAYVVDPVPGVYDRVVPFDFASLYPSIIIAYNIDYSTLVPEGSTIPDSECNIFEWDEHIGCPHDTQKRKTKPKHILCGHRYFRFLKSPKGVLPMLLEDLLLARKKTRAEQKDIDKAMKTEEDDGKKADMKTLYDVLEKRQLSYKVSANSGYGAMGVSRGYLPLMPGAMCVTAKGRESIRKVMKIITEQYQGELVYGDTDSNYVTFPGITDLEALWQHAEKVSDEVSRNFPKPMKLEFEGFIYWRFLILTRKRYMSLKCKRDGIVEHKIEKKGVLLNRRDNSNFVRKVYSDIIMKIFDKEDKDKILQDCILHINTLCAGGYNYKDFIITKSIGNVGDLKPQPIPGKTKKVMIGDYTVDTLRKNEDEKAKQLALKKCDNEADFYLHCLPAQIQLAEKMRRRGQRVDVGSRLEYLIVTHPLGEKAKQYEKIESSEYYASHASSLDIDYMYYLKALANPLDQVLSCVFGQSNLILQQYKQQLAKRKVMSQLNSLFSPDINFE